MANIIKIKRGLKKDLPASSVSTTGELRYTLDTNELFIDNGTENKLIINSNSKVDKSNVPHQIYGTDSEGNQTTYDKESFGKVDDVLIGTQSIVVDKIATLGTMASENANEYTKSTGFADVAFSGDYEDLSNTPALSTVATSGKYEDLLEKPILSTVALTGKYEDLLNKPFIPTTKTDIGLGNVDNTSDLDKPISTATQTALNNKQNKLTAGTNISINNDTISAIDTKYTAGTNIAISSDNVISATDTKYTAGTDITISNNVVSNKYPEVFLTQEEYDVLANNNQLDPNTYYNTIDTSVPLNIDDVILILPSLNEGDSLKQGTLAFVEV